MTATPNGSQPVQHDWFEHAFGDLYPIIYAHRTVAAAEPEALFAAAVLKLTANDRVLDLCCGCGRHLVHLLPFAGRTAGLDFSAQLLWFARGLLGAGTPLVRGDMRAAPFRESFDVVTNFFTSFGYFFSDAENAEVVRSVAGSLRPGGRFFIDYLNPVHAEQTLVPHSVRDEAGYTIEDRRWIDPVLQRINKTTVVMRDGETINEFHESVRLYHHDAFVALLEDNGLRVDHVYGNYSGDAYDDGLPRLIAVGHRA